MLRLNSGAFKWPGTDFLWYTALKNLSNGCSTSGKLWICTTSWITEALLYCNLQSRRVVPTVLQHNSEAANWKKVGLLFYILCVLTVFENWTERVWCQPKIWLTSCSNEIKSIQFQFILQYRHRHVKARWLQAAMICPSHCFYGYHSPIRENPHPFYWKRALENLSNVSNVGRGVQWGPPAFIEATNWSDCNFKKENDQEHVKEK